MVVCVCQIPWMKPTLKRQTLPKVGESFSSPSSRYGLIKELASHWIRQKLKCELQGCCQSEGFRTEPDILLLLLRLIVMYPNPDTALNRQFKGNKRTFTPFYILAHGLRLKSSKQMYPLSGFIFRAHHAWNIFRLMWCSRFCKRLSCNKIKPAGDQLPKSLLRNPGLFWTQLFLRVWQIGRRSFLQKYHPKWTEWWLSQPSEIRWFFFLKEKDAPQRSELKYYSICSTTIKTFSISVSKHSNSGFFQ